jgi:hypothetical protein
MDPTSLKYDSDGFELAQAWITWANRIDDVESVDLDRLELSIRVSDHVPPLIVMEVDPDLMARAFPLLSSEGALFWTDIDDERERAWRMLSVDLEETLASLEDGVKKVGIAVGRRVAGVGPVERH